MTLQALFPTLVYTAPLLPGRSGVRNRRLLQECLQLRHDDRAGRSWSAGHYPGGYTSYSSQCRMQQISPTFAQLEKLLDGHVRRHARSLDLDLKGRKLAMTDCWVNIMPPRVAHGSHLHPLSTLSGTYYVQVPPGSPGLKFEDPRLARMMAAPPRRHSAPRALQPWVVMPAQAGGFFLFESWLRHEVAANRARGQRISISFNYSWF
jgi:uncharacterized protein (TIGR02466 family)